ncbi:hypothetical protein Ait01nite_004680 [Actinoplanes italicus]|nr:hypothetical protein Ait01nite_004680 [Actinoplanes italicus]
MGRWAIAAGVTVTVILPLAVPAAAIVVNPGTRQGSLTQAGPLAEHGFPAWYRDSNGLRLEACTTLEDPLCSTLPDEVPNPDAPVSYPENFPGEFFYQLAGAEMTLSNGVDFGIGMDLEGAWAAEEVRDGDQMVFGRVRIRFDANEGDRFRITHPYGIDDLTATDRGVNMTEDIGTTPGAFGAAIASRIGPFLKWDPAVAPAAPAGYTGDPGVDHRVVGSPYATNFVRVEQLNPATGAVIAQLGFTDLFSVQGRYATNAGVDIDQATYTVGADGNGVVEVYASSEPGQSIEVSANATLGFRTTKLRGGNGRYYGRFPVTGPVPPGATIEVVNSGDRPIARKSRKVVDVIRVSEARYDSDAGTLTVVASSSDADSTPPALSVTGFGPINGPFTGVSAPPAAITVTSTGGGSTTVPLTGTGQVFLPDIPVASAVATAGAVAGQRVTLDGSGSTGAIDSYAWSQVGGPNVPLADATLAKASFTPTAPGTYSFRLAVSGPGGAGLPATVTVVIAGTAPARADAGADQTVVRGRAVTLDGSASTGAETYSWRQVSGPAVNNLVGATSAKPTFSYPAQAMPAVPGPNTGFVYNNDPVVMELTVTNPAGTGTARVTVRPQAEALGGLTVRYRTGNNEWRISGTSNLLAGQRVTAVLGSTLTGRVIGSPVTVDAAGAFSIRVTGPNPAGVNTISFVTSTGAQVLGTPVNVTN